MSMTEKIPRPDFVTDEHLTFLDDLRTSGRVNMFGARANLIEEFDFEDDATAAKVLTYWMKSFSERHPK